VMVLTDGALAAFGPRDEVLKPAPAAAPPAAPAPRRMAGAVPGPATFATGSGSAR
jgi:ABC-type protease/lipase transport system fused ATPase/permease subunit